MKTYKQLLSIATDLQYDIETNIGCLLNRNKYLQETFLSLDKLDNFKLITHKGAVIMHLENGPAVNLVDVCNIEDCLNIYEQLENIVNKNNIIIE